MKKTKINYIDVGYIIRGLAFDLSCIKNDLKK